MVETLRILLSIRTKPSDAQVVSLDLESVGVDLAAVPFGDVLAFRREHLKQHRAYARAVRKFVNDASALPGAEQEKSLKNRREEIRDIASDLRNISRQAWKRPAYFGLTLIGTAFAAKGSGPIAGILTAALGILGAPAPADGHTQAYSYLFSAAGRFGY